MITIHRFIVNILNYCQRTFEMLGGFHPNAFGQRELTVGQENLGTGFL